MRILGGILFLIAGFFPAFAQSDAPTADTDPVLVFNRICYSQVPALDSIRDMATRFAWEPIGGEDLREFTKVDKPSILQGWDVRIAKKLYRLGIVQSPLTDSFSQAFPAFSQGTATGCTLVLDGNDEADIVLNRMNTLAGKEPATADIPDGELLTTTWAGGNDEFKVFLIYKSDSGGKAHLLNVTILAKQAN
ncbi:MAG: hypothetical protein AAF478_00535 [Pseudomonadota bacterium]